MTTIKNLRALNKIPIIEKLFQFIKLCIDDSKLYDRKKWTLLLRVSPGSISHWLKGSHIPKPKKLKIMFDNILNYNSECIDTVALNRLLDEKLNEDEVDVLKALTIGDYVLKEDLNEIIDSIKFNPYVIKRELIITFKRLLADSIAQNNGQNINQIVSSIREIQLNKNKDKKILNKATEEEKTALYDIASESCEPPDIRFNILFINSLEKYKEITNIQKKFIQKKLDKHLINSTSVFLPIHNHFYEFKKSNEEFYFYHEIYKMLEEDKYDKIIDLTSEFHQRLIEKKITEINPGLILSLIQTILYKEKVFIKTITLDSINELRHIFLKIYEESIYQKLFIPNEITSSFYYKIVDIACGYNELKFVNYFTKKFGKLLNDTNSKDVKISTEFCKKILSGNLNNAYKYSSNKTKIKNITFRINFGFRNLLLFWLIDDKHQFESEANFLNNKIWDRSLEKSSSDDTNFKKLNMYRNLQKVNKNKIAINKFLKESNDVVLLGESNLILNSINALN